MGISKANSLINQKEIKSRIIIDPEDQSILDQYVWWISHYGYAFTTLKTKKNIGLHHILIGRPLKGFVVDHKNGIKLDNRRCNLHFVNASYNMANRKKRKDSLQKYKGVQLLYNGKYRAKTSGGKQIGSVCETAEEAKNIFDNYQIKTYGIPLYANA